MTETIGFGEALKAFRRGVHVYGPDWRGVILSDSVIHLARAGFEASKIFDASSLVPQYNGANQIFKFDPSGATMGLRLARDLLDVDTLRGNAFAHVIWVFQPRDDVQERVKAMLRSPTIEQSKLRMDYSGL